MKIRLAPFSKRGALECLYEESKDNTDMSKYEAFRAEKGTQPCNTKNVTAYLQIQYQTKTAKNAHK